jgi:hypothetical protein
MAKVSAIIALVSLARMMWTRSFFVVLPTSLNARSGPLSLQNGPGLGGDPLRGPDPLGVNGRLIK